MAGLAKKTLLNNARSGRYESEDGSKEYFYICPSRRIYPHQWLWDSCFHVIAMSHFDVGLAQAELRSLMSCIREDGFIPHVIEWGARRGGVLGKVKARLYGLSPFAHLTQPPVLAISVREIYRHSGDPAFLRDVLPDIKLYYRHLATHRDPDRDGLITIINPVESGMDALPVYDRVLGVERPSAPVYHLAVAGLSARHILGGWNLSHAISEDTTFSVEDVGVNSIYAYALRALAELCDLVDDPDATEFRHQAERTERSMIRKCYDPEQGMFYSLHSRAEVRIPVNTVSSLLPLLLEELPDHMAARIVDEHLTNAREFWLPYPVPSVSASEPDFDPESPRLYTDTGLAHTLGRNRHRHRLVWRGPSWVNTNWFLARGLRMHGFADVADALAEKTAEVVEREGYWEYYHPYTGAGQGAAEFGWSTLLVDMLSDYGKVAGDVARADVSQESLATAS